MLSRLHKIPKASFQKVYTQGKKSFSPLFRIIQLHDQNEARFAVVIAKKVIRGAVRRNREKRRIYTALWHHTKHLSGSIIIILNKDTRELSLSALEEALQKSLAGK